MTPKFSIMTRANQSAQRYIFSMKLEDREEKWKKKINEMAPFLFYKGHNHKEHILKVRI